MGIAQAKLPAYAEEAAATPFNQTSARPTGASGYLAIAQEAF